MFIYWIWTCFPLSILSMFCFCPESCMEQIELPIPLCTFPQWNSSRQFVVIETVNLNHCLLAEFAVILRVSAGVFPCCFKTCTVESFLQPVFYYKKYISPCYKKVQIVLFLFFLEAVVNVNTDWRNAWGPYYRSIKSDTQIREIKETKWRIRKPFQYYFSKLKQYWNPIKRWTIILLFSSLLFFFFCLFSWWKFLT